MKTSSAKNKGRRCSHETKQLLHSYTDTLESGDIEITSSGAPGRDLKLSPGALKIFPFTIENKNVEKINIWKAISQSESHAHNTSLVPLLVFKRNRSELYVTLKFKDFLDLTQKNGGEDELQNHSVREVGECQSRRGNEEAREVLPRVGSSENKREQNKSGEASLHEPNDASDEIKSATDAVLARGSE